MFGYLLLGISAILGMISTVLAKKFQINMFFSKLNFMRYCFINSLVACIYFLAASGFRIELNGITLVFAVVYAVDVFSSLIIQLYVYSAISISLSSVLSMSGTIILPTLFGIVFFKEAVTIRMLLSLVLILLAVVLPGVKGAQLQRNKKTLIICFIFFGVNGLAVILSQLYAKNPHVCSANSYFFVTNVILGVVCAFYLFRNYIKYGAQQDKKTALSAQQIGNIVIRTVLSNVCAVLSILLLKEMEVSMYTILSAALGLIGNVIISKLVFKEQVDKETLAAVVLAIGAIAANP